MAVTTPKLEAGAFITPNVKLLHPLAEGGMGRVWVAEHLGLNTNVVVKMMADAMLVREDGAERFAREAAAAAAIKSPHVCQVFDHGLAKVEGSESVPYIVMELLEGKDLGAHLAEHGRGMDPLDVVAIVTQVGKALLRAHKAGIVHRDIKPDNIFLCETDDHSIFVKLLDFGTAKKDGVVEMKTSPGGGGGGSDGETQTLVGPPPTAPTGPGRTTVPGQIMGTPYYMSPEQSVGGEIDERSDIWSLGVVVFEALTGRKPFDGPSIGAIAIAIHGPLPRITDHVPGLPVAVDEWFERACAQAPADRFQNIRDAMSAFVLAVTGNALTFDPPTESVHVPHFPHPGLMRTPSPSPGGTSPVSISTRPQAMLPLLPEPLIASLPARGSERRPTMIAAGLVVATAGIAMMAIILSRSPSSSSGAGPESQGVVATSAQVPAAATTPSPSPSPAPIPTVVSPPAEPEPATQAPAPPKVAAKHAAKPAAPLPPQPPAPQPTSPLKRTNAPTAAPTTPNKPPAGPDDDLAALSKAAAKHSAEAPAPTPAPPPPAPAPAPAPPPLPAE
jgi:eukaryotic-like serine/threonine-protein kinase